MYLGATIFFITVNNKKMLILQKSCVSEKPNFFTYLKRVIFFFIYDV